MIRQGIKRRIKNIILAMISKLNRVLLQKPYMILIITILYVIFLRTVNVAYCSWITDQIFWDFPLEQDTAKQYWEEAPVGNISEKSKQQHEILAKHKENMQDIEEENIRAKRRMEKLSKIAQNKKAAEDLAFLESIKNLPLHEKAREINVDIYDKICKTISKNPSTQKINITAIVYDVVSKHCTFNMWLAKSEAELKDPTSLAGYMLECNHAGIRNNDFNEAERGILAHMSAHIQIFNAQNVLIGGLDPDQSFFKDKGFYNSLYKTNLHS